MPRLLLLAVLLPLAAGCTLFRPAPPSPAGPAAEVAWGSSFGMCRGYCVSRLEVSSAGIATLTETSNRDDALPPRVRSRPLSPGEMDTLTFARGISPLATATLGCPDCADGGAEYVEAGGQRVTFEYRGDAGAATQLAEALRQIAGTFPRDPANL